MARSWTEKFFITRTHHMATVRACLLCKHTELVRKGRPGVGRGYGMREGNMARGRMMTHIKEAHPEFETAKVTDEKHGYAALRTVDLDGEIRRFPIPAYERFF